MSDTRIYLVEVKFPDVDEPDKTKHLVEATNQAQALRHVTKDLATCEIPSTKQVAKLVAAGVAVESA